MRRRDFLAGIGAAFAWAPTARGQTSQYQLPTIGVIGGGDQENYQAFAEGLRELGYVSGQMVALDARFHDASAAEFARMLSRNQLCHG